MHSLWDEESVCAVIVTRGEDYVEETIKETLGQSANIAALRIVAIGSQDSANRLSNLARSFASQKPRPCDVAVIALSGARNFGDAIRQAMTSERFGSDYKWLWLLHADSCPETDALGELLTAAKKTASVALVGPKQVEWEDPNRVLEVGIEATASAKRLSLPWQSEIDQGQYDGREDVLAVGTAGALIRQTVWTQTRGLDPYLGPFGDGLEYGRRVRRCGYRVVVAPKARVRHRRQSYARPLRERFRRERTEQLYNWLMTVRWWAVLPLLVILLPWSLLRSLGQLVLRRPALAAAELASYFALLSAVPALTRGRRRLRRQARIPASALSGLQLSGREYRSIKKERRKIAAAQRPEEHIDQQARRVWIQHRRGSRIWFWSLLTGLTLLSVLISHRLFGSDGVNTWIASGYWKNLPTQWGTLWDQTVSQWGLSGHGSANPVNPLLLPLLIFTAPFALFGIPPASSVSLLLYFALALGFVGGWHFGGLICPRTQWKIAAGLLWCAQPALLEAIRGGDLQAVLFAICLPWVGIGLWKALGFSMIVRIQGVNDAITAAQWERVVWAAVSSAAMIVCSAALPLLPALVVVAALPWCLLGQPRRALTMLETGRPALGQQLLLLCLVVVPVTISLFPPYYWAASQGAARLLSLVNPTAQTTLAQVPHLAWWETLLFSGGAFGAYVFISAATVTLVLATFALLKSFSDSKGLGLVVGAWLLAILSFALVRTIVHLADSGQQLTSSPVVMLGYLGILLAALSLSKNSPLGAPVSKAIGALNLLVAALAIVGGFILPTAVSLETTPGQVPLVARHTQQSDTRGRLAVLTPANEDGSIDVQIWRGNGVEEASQSWGKRAAQLSLAGQTAISSLADAVGALEVSSPQAVQTLCDHGIAFVLIPAIADGEVPTSKLRGVLDATEGMERIGTTELGTMWRVKPDFQTCARAYFLNDDERIPLNAGNVEARGNLTVAKPGVLYLAEIADPGWKAFLDGKELRSIPDPVLSEGWRQAFELPAGAGVVSVVYRPAWLPWWQWSLAASLVVVAVCIIPWRPKRRKWAELQEVDREVAKTAAKGGQDGAEPDEES